MILNTCTTEVKSILMSVRKKTYRSVVMFIYRKKCLLIKMGKVTLYTAYPLL